MKLKTKFDYKLLIAIAIFLTTTFIMFWSQIQNESFFWEDFVEQVYPLQNFAAVESSQGITPYWNPYTFSGMPFIADPQVGFYYPLNRLMDFFVEDGALNPDALQLLIILHFFIAQLTMFLFLRSQKLNFASTLLGAVGYAFSMIFICHVFHPMMIYHFAWLPLAFMLFKQALDKRKILYALWSGLVLAMMFLSGHPQTTLYVLILFALYFIWDLVTNLKNKSFESIKKLIVYLSSAAVAMLIAAGIYMIQYLPSKEMFNYSVRQETTLEKASEGSLEFKQIVQTFIPKAFGYINGDGSQDMLFSLKQTGNTSPWFYWDTAFYFGIGIFILGLIAMLALWRNKMISFAILITLFGFLFALGENSFLLKILYNFPLVGTFRMPARILFFAVFGFSIAAAYGADYLLKAKELKSVLKYILIAVSVPTLISLAGISGVLSGMLDMSNEASEFLSVQARNTFLFSVLTFVLCYFSVKSIFKREIAVYLLVAVVFVDLSMAGGNFNKGAKSISDEYNLPQEQKNMFVPSSINNLFRVNTRIPKYGVITMKRNQGMLDRIMMLEGYNPLNLKLRVPPAPSKSEAYDLLNTKYQLEVDFQKQSVFYTDKISRFPRFWLAGNYEVHTEKKIESIMKENSVDLRNVALLEENPKFSENPPGPVNGKVIVQQYNSNKIVMNVTTDRNSILMASEVWYPAWKVYIDGKLSNVYKADYCLRGAMVPTGSHKVEYKYESDAYKSGANIAFVTLILTFISIIITTFLNIKKIKGKENA